MKIWDVVTYVAKNKSYGVNTLIYIFGLRMHETERFYFLRKKYTHTGEWGVSPGSFRFPVQGMPVGRRPWPGDRHILVASQESSMVSMKLRARRPLQPFSDPNLNDGLPGYTEASCFSVQTFNHPNWKIHVHSFLFLTGSSCLR